MKEESITIGGESLKIYRSGKGARPVVLIHGLGSSARDWEHQLPALEEHCDILMLDLRGHGASSRGFQEYSIPVFVEDVIAVIEERFEPAHLVGVSMGGMIGYQISAARPDLVKSLTVINSLPEFGSLSLKKKIKFMQRLLLVQFGGMRKAAEKMSWDLFPLVEQEQLRTTFIERWSENCVGIYRKTLWSMASWSVVDSLPDISAPTLVITGDRDYISPEKKQSYARLMPDCKVEVIADSGHATPVDQPERLNQVLITFLETHHRASAG